MTIFDAVRKEDLGKWLDEQSKSREGELKLCNDALAGYSLKGTLLRGLIPTIKAIPLEDLRKEIEGMRVCEDSFSLTAEAKEARIYNQALDDLLKKLEEGR